MIGVFVNSKHVPYARKIVEGSKLFESRTKNTLKKLVGKRVGIIETGNGYPMIVGEVTIGNPRFVTKRMWDGLYRALSCVPYGSEYDASDEGKWCYEMKEPIPYDEPIFLPKNAIRHGRAWCEFDI